MNSSARHRCGAGRMCGRHHEHRAASDLVGDLPRMQPLPHPSGRRSESGTATLQPRCDGAAMGSGTVRADSRGREPAMRARYPDRTGFVERDGVKVAYEVFGDGPRTVLLMPSWSIVHSRMWKAQVPYLARHARVVTFDGRGNGLSDRPRESAAYDSAEFVADGLAVLDAVEVEQALVVGSSLGAGYAIELAATAPQRVSALFLLGPTVANLSEPESAEPKSRKSRKRQRWVRRPDPSSRPRSASTTAPLTRGTGACTTRTCGASAFRTSSTSFSVRCSVSRTPRSRSRMPPAGRWRPMARRSSLPRTGPIWRATAPR